MKSVVTRVEREVRRLDQQPGRVTIIFCGVAWGVCVPFRRVARCLSDSRQTRVHCHCGGFSFGMLPAKGLDEEQKHLLSLDSLRAMFNAKADHQKRVMWGEIEALLLQLCEQLHGGPHQRTREEITAMFRNRWFAVPTGFCLFTRFRDLAYHLFTKPVAIRAEPAAVVLTGVPPPPPVIPAGPCVLLPP
jgi:hypothetical protein